MAPTDVASTARTAPAAFRSAVPSSDLPATALAAYQRAESVINASSPGCALSWQFLAAIAQVETDHGRRTPPAADAGPDTDAGMYDGTPERDQLSGPFQIAPVTWAAVAVDADGDGTRDLHDLDDAALGLAVLLCSTGEDLSTDPGRRAALQGHNRDRDYADLVLELTAAYAMPGRLSAGLTATSLVAPRPVAPAAARTERRAGGGSSFTPPRPSGGHGRAPETAGSEELPTEPALPETPTTPEEPSTPQPEPTEPSEPTTPCLPPADETTPPDEAPTTNAPAPDDTSTAESEPEETPDEDACAVPEEVSPVPADRPEGTEAPAADPSGTRSRTTS